MAENVDVRTSLAMSKGAITAADFTALASAQGVPISLDKGNNHVVVLFAQQCCDHHGSRAVRQVRPPTTFFDASEHIVIVAGCKLRVTPSRTEDALMARLPVGPHLSLTYGQVIALGGDFYGDPDHPICNAGSREQQIAKFQENFKSLQSSDEVKQILQIVEQYEFQPIAERVKHNLPPSGVYAGMPTSGPHLVPDEDRAFDAATGGTWLKNGRYLNLAMTNLDHFGADAVTAYLAGHILAQRRAKLAKTSANPETELKVAYAINAFADHFLTDLFSAGHMRVPRRHLYQYSKVLPAALSGLCTKGMHDEDNKFGLWVTNGRGDRWVAYGDGRYRDWCNAANRKVMKAAVQQSMDEVWNAYDLGTEVGDDSVVLQFIPKPIEDTINWAPLFTWKDNDIYQRNSVDNIADRTSAAASTADLAVTAGKLYARKGPYMPEGQYKANKIPYPPNETGPSSGEFGWPAGPTARSGYNRVRGTTGPDIGAVEWKIDGTSGPGVPPEA